MSIRGRDVSYLRVLQGLAYVCIAVMCVGCRVLRVCALQCGVCVAGSCVCVRCSVVCVCLAQSCVHISLCFMCARCNLCASCSFVCV